MLHLLGLRFQNYLQLAYSFVPFSISSLGETGSLDVGWMDGWNGLANGVIPMVWFTD